LPLRLVFGVALLFAAAARGDPEQCREALAAYNDVVTAVHYGIRDYSRCLAASRARDDCGAEFIELQVTHRDFEAAVAAHGLACPGAPREPR
jgi:hypothetical protein